MFDPELEAIVKCTELLSPLEDSSKMRVLQYLANRYDLIGNSQVGNVRPLVNLPLQSSETAGQSQTAQTNAHEADFPALKDVVARDLPKTETDWMLVYCFYSSDFGTNSFTKADLVDKYKSSKRWTETRRKNFGGTLNALIKRRLIKSLNDEEYQTTDEGRTQAGVILAGNSTSKSHGGKPKNKKVPIRKIQENSGE